MIFLMNYRMKYNVYESPLVEVIEIEVEEGYSSSYDNSVGVEDAYWS